MATPMQSEHFDNGNSAISHTSKNGSKSESTATGSALTSLVRKPTGPRTQQGKERSKNNAVTHGIFSKAVVLKGESQAEFDALLSGLRDDLQPEGALEEVLVNKLASLFVAQSPSVDCGRRRD